MGIDIFSKDLEDIFAPSDGEIVASGKETCDHSFGHYLIFKPVEELTHNYIFLGHLSSDLLRNGIVKAGQKLLPWETSKMGKMGVGRDTCMYSY